MTKLCFVDTETISLERNNPDVIWEAALIVQEEKDGVWRETFSKVWQLEVDLGNAEAIALRIGQFNSRRSPTGELTPKSDFATDFARWTSGSHLVGAIISFDEERLHDLLRANGACPDWHYHIIDVEALCVGYIAGAEISPEYFKLTPPWKSADIFDTLGFDRNKPEFAEHTAMGDARLVQAVYNRVMGIELA